MLTTILATAVVLGVLIFVHELGHFLTAKLVGIDVLRFSIGFGPRIWGFRRGETEYVISALPLGGYVKMAGLEEMERIEGGRPAARGVPVGDVGLVQEEVRPPGPREFEAKPLPARALVISAGVLMNLLFAVAVFTASALVWGIERVPEARIAAVRADRLPPGAEALAHTPRLARVVAVDGREVDDWADLRTALLVAPPGPATVRFADAPPITVRLPADDSARAALVEALQPHLEPVLGAVAPGSPAARAGLRPGDRIVEAAGRPVRTWHDLIETIEPRLGRPVPLTVRRGEETIRVTVVPVAQRERADGRARVVGRIGVATRTERLGPGPLGALVHGMRETGRWVGLTVGFLGDLVTGDVSARSVGGPILIGEFSGRAARAGLEAFLRFMAIFSINLAVLNLLPIPVLDGGHLLFLGIEAVRGRALSLRQRIRLTQIGMAIVVAIMVWALANDMLRLLGF